jgi:hypothetical protein
MQEMVMSVRGNGKSDHTKDLVEALGYVFVSPNEADSNYEAANVVDGLYALSRAVYALADAIEKKDAPA